MTDNPTLALTRYAASTSLEALPADVVDRAKQVIFDEVACACFGRRSLAGDLGARYAGQFGGAAEARIHASAQRVAAPYAALANGAAGHGEEVDGAHVVGGHPGASIVHAAVAMAERQRSSGAELINAVVLGYEVGTRVVKACGTLFSVKNRFGLNSDFLYTLGATAAACRLMRLDSNAHGHALALSTFQSNALCAFYAEKRHISKSFCNGQFAFTGVSAALMAVAGLEGHEDILGAPYGVLHAWGVEGGREILLDRLGSHFGIMDANFKLLNAGYPIHAPVEAALTLVAQHGIAPSAIESIDVGMPTQTMKVVDNRDMHNICLQDMLSAALVRGGLALRESPFPAVLNDPVFQQLRPRVQLRGHPDLDRDQPDGRGAIVTMTTRDGAVVSARIDYPKGHSRRGGLSWSDLSAKWREGMPERDVDRIASHTRRLEDAEDVCEWLDTFSARP
ncbi:MmgE/PrpD family protein [Azohydromonas australica]|uniref:MmgE/PrpD family protein n=1 Tax=Azohydromonas australica TaxID=364039 RepID=UPI00041A7DB6|nr:MmgE/PrpD family protein [Azohydromonas australica]